MSETVLFHVAEYIRLSREDGDKTESDSVGSQRKLIADFIKGKDEFNRYDTYIDDGWTGTNFKRPAFQRMIADLEAGKINCVIVKDLSRFGRDYIDTGKYLERYFPAHNIRFIAIVDNIDSFRQTYDLLLPLKNIFNEQYARDISKKIHASVSTKQKAGEFIGAFASYGYQKSPTDKNRLVIDPYAAGVVRRIFDLYVSGCGKMRIAAILNAQGIVCPAEYKRLNGENYRNSRKLDSTSYWTYSTINRLLRNEMYLGHMVQGRKSQQMGGKAQAKERKDWIVVKNTHEAIIDAVTWEQVRELLRRRTRQLNLENNMTIFAGFLKCGDCGRALTRKGQNYYCGTYVRSGRHYCTPHPIPHEVLEKIILDDLQALFHAQDNLRAVIGQAGEWLKKGETVEKTAEGAETEKTTMTEAMTGKAVRVAEKSSAIAAKSTKQETDRKENRLYAELEKVRRLKKAVYEDYREELLSREEYISYRQEYLQKEELLVCRLESEKNAPLSPVQSPSEDIFETPWIKRLLTDGTIEKPDRNLIVTILHGIRVYANRKIHVTYNF